MLLSGNILPLPLYPDWMHAFLFVQPFAGVYDIPFRIYFGQLTGPMAWAGLGLQAFWTAVLVLLGRQWTEGVMRQLQVQGG
jgi:ABC-2 type transport system permease protein